MRSIFTSALLAALTPAAAWAVGAEVEDRPTRTETTLQCAEGQIYTAETDVCADIADSPLNDDALYEVARELAYFGRLDDALAVLSQMSEPESGRVQTYLGFVARQMGDFDQAMIHYQAALEIDPNNILARSYLGMAYIARGDHYMAHFQLQQIRYRGAQGSWPEQALAEAIRTGSPIDY